MRAPTALAALGLSLTLALSGCSTLVPEAAAPSPDVLAAAELADASGRQIVDTLEADPQPRPLAVSVSVKEDHLVVSDGGSERTVALPEDLFYVSVAPYVSSTHDCFYHALGGCQGELPGEEVDVRITDGGGSVLVEKTVTTHANGFVGFWLPRGIEGGTVEMTTDEGTGQVPLSTTPGSPTCLTTLQLLRAR